ncbi:hypothetical protein SADUNF_Sadunf15G0120600 [Salix dunnii]|uniref:Uncharacterized protein n=1 Tax=Salix dunnii TaxID=1413687 RepID=A0A835MPA7_9ROSI|nr:hypothetical protein SADUNF_Sadunf15G0120600 [Salix dunnii]
MRVNSEGCGHAIEAGDAGVPLATLVGNCSCFEPPLKVLNQEEEFKLMQNLQIASYCPSWLNSEAFPFYHSYQENFLPLSCIALILEHDTNYFDWDYCHHHCPQVAIDQLRFTTLFFLQKLVHLLGQFGKLSEFYPCARSVTPFQPC